MGAASFTCSTVLPLMIAPSSNSIAQPSLSTLKTMASIPRFAAATCVLNLVRKDGFKKSRPILLSAPSFLSAKGLALYANAFATNASIAAPVLPFASVSISCTEIKFFISLILFLLLLKKYPLLFLKYLMPVIT